MWKHYLKMTGRQLRRHPRYSLLNLFGLTVGFTAVLLVGVYVQHERSYDRFHDEAPRLVRVVSDFVRGDDVFPYAYATAPLGPALAAALPEVAAFTRIWPVGNRPPRVQQGARTFWEPGLAYADASVFEVFAFPLRAGDPATALAQPNTVVLTEEAARKYFGPEDPMGRTLTVADTLHLTVTGLLAPMPAPSHLSFEMLASLTTHAADLSDPRAWMNGGYYTYLLLESEAATATVADKLPEVVARYLPEGLPSLFRYHLQPLTDIHLHSHRRSEIGTNGRAAQVYLFLGIALLILVIASLNYVNLSLAQGLRRAREVGVRKTLGAQRRQLLGQLLSEAFLFNSLGGLLALGATALLLPAFGALMNRSLHLEALGPGGWLAMGLGLLLLTVLAGGYPALFLASLRPARVLKGGFQPGRLSRLRQGMLAAQMALATLLIVGTLVARAQMAYIAERPLGFAAEQVVALPMNEDAEIARQYPRLKQALLAQPSVRHVAAASGTPGRARTFYSNPLQQVGEADWHTVRSLAIDADFVETYGLRLLAGRTFAPASPNGFLINEALMRELGWAAPDDALGQRLNWKGSVEGEVIGIVADFHFLGIQAPLEPVLLAYRPAMFNFVSIRTEAAEMTQALAAIEKTWQQLLPDHPFAYFFVEADYARQYQATRQTARLVRGFSLLAVLLACLGLFGLAAYAAEQRTRELGIRKVFGAGLPGLLYLLAQPFLRMALLGLAVGMPLAYALTQSWLSQFAYHATPGAGLFSLAGLLVLLNTVLSIGHQAWRTARQAPIESLRHE